MALLIISTGTDTAAHMTVIPCRPALDYEPTIGVDFRTHYEMPVKDIRMKLQIWDVSGDPAMRSTGDLLR